MTQTWHDLLFAHWPLPPQVLRPLVPAQLPLDAYEGQCWLAVTPFHMSNVCLRGLPPIPGFSSLPELNVRTYVKLDNKPGVYFFSLDAASMQAVLAARLSFGLPYFWSKMSVKESVRDQIEYSSIRRQKPRPAEVKVDYAPDGPDIERKSELEVFLTERYCLYVVRRGQVHRAQIHHLPWPLRPAEAEFRENTLAAAHGFELSEPPQTLHFAKRLDVVIFGPERVG